MLIIWLVSWSPGASAGTQITATAKARAAMPTARESTSHPQLLGQHDRGQHDHIAANAGDPGP
jgi:hypothetical protein